MLRRILLLFYITTLVSTVSDVYTACLFEFQNEDACVFLYPSGLFCAQVKDSCGTPIQLEGCNVTISQCGEMSKEDQKSFCRPIIGRQGKKTELYSEYCRGLKRLNANN
ncbi:hypothetical protein BY458DRAFT_490859 [Sporodiniella umbellata]|nr:hypothetical protein BY458DRAFT_490859 [Sporodiniella umbellata]